MRFLRFQRQLRRLLSTTFSSTAADAHRRRKRRKRRRYKRLFSDLVSNNLRERRGGFVTTRCSKLNLEISPPRITVDNCPEPFHTKQHSPSDKVQTSPATAAALFTAQSAKSPRSMVIFEACQRAARVSVPVVETINRAEILNVHHHGQTPVTFFTVALHDQLQNLHT